MAVKRSEADARKRRALKTRVVLTLELMGLSISQAAKRYAMERTQFTRMLAGVRPDREAIWEKIAEDFGFDPRTQVNATLRAFLKEVANP